MKFSYIKNLSNKKVMIEFVEIMLKKRKGLLHVLGEKEKAEVFWIFADKKNSNGEHEFEYQKNMLFWMMESFHFSRRDRKRIETVVDFLGERYRDKNRKFDFRISALNFVSGNREPMVNHPLGVAIIALALLDEGILNKKVPSRNRSELKSLRRKKRVIVFSGMLHDFCEDKKGGEHCIREILSEIKLPQKEVELIIDTGKVLTRRRTKTIRESSEDYILRISHCGNPIAPFLKGVDILHNALSPHKDTQKEKYKSCYIEFVLRMFPFVGFLVPDWVEEKIYEENEYLRAVAERMMNGNKLPHKKVSRKR